MARSTSRKESISQPAPQPTVIDAVPIVSTIASTQEDPWWASTIRNPIAFHDYMALVLYDAKHGYYASGRAQIGRHGDFFTNASIGPLFAELVGRQFQIVWETWAQPTPFVIIEQGAHDGVFARDLLGWIQQAHPKFYKSIAYWIIEPSATLRAIQHQQLQLHAPKVRHFCSLEEVPAGINGVFWGNELIDAFPVHLVVKKKGGETPSVPREGDGGRHEGAEENVREKWQERYVTANNGKLEYRNQDITNPELLLAVNNLPPRLPEDYQTEIRLAHRPWLRALSRIWSNGVIFLCDYGFLFDTYYTPERKTGTLQCYHRHKRSENPLQNPGEQDITAHVEFTTFINDAGNLGYTPLGFTDQHHALVGAAEPWLRSIDGQPVSASNQSKLRQFTQLSHPTAMGTQFHFLILQLGTAAQPTLDCLRYARRLP